MTRSERIEEALREARQVLEALDVMGGMGLDVHRHVRATIAKCSAALSSPADAPRDEYRLMREAAVQTGVDMYRRGVEDAARLMDECSLEEVPGPEVAAQRIRALVEPSATTAREGERVHSDTCIGRTHDSLGCSCGADAHAGTKEDET